MVLHVKRCKQWMAVGEILARFTALQQLPHLRWEKSPTPWLLAGKNTGEEGKSTTVPSVQVKTITGAVSTEDAPQGRQVPGMQ